ncbi:hypothetical protein [Parendozoicomonas haliclonae]|uniref:Uncharacterized protein n=1 Tax=Parendozoicomonas haliclonae TaxID=1960125 RepID=A0A1X7ALT6_9GAMM|nr:hypothetical protein [Parendozoicomonas haliclonae]SMA49101.1 hypothetical protein EHSB41UT_03051 [Parendozoicomonas haliclonae]
MVEAKADKETAKPSEPPPESPGAESPSGPVLLELFDLLQVIWQSWGQRTRTLHQLVRAESQLNLRAVMVMVGLIMLIAMVVFSLWIGLIGLVGVGVFLLTGTLGHTLIVMALLQLILLVWLAGELRRIWRRLGFHRTASLLSSSTQLSGRGKHCD